MNPKTLKLNELAIQNALFWELRAGYRVVLPNYTPNGWWENDLFAVSRADLWTEHEIKISVKDFKDDASKTQFIGRSKLQVNKHELLAEKSKKGPNRFFYVLPDAVAEKVEIPEWAGLKVARVSASGRVYVKTEKKAPLLHSEPVKAKVVEHARGACYWRFWNVRTKAEVELSRRIERMVSEVTPREPSRLKLKELNDALKESHRVMNRIYRYYECGEEVDRMLLPALGLVEKATDGVIVIHLEKP